MQVNNSILMFTRESVYNCTSQIAVSTAVYSGRQDYTSSVQSNYNIARI